MERDLWPWILGGVLITTGTIAAAIQFAAHAPKAAPAMRTSSAPTVASVAAVTAPGFAAAEPAPTPSAEPAPVPSSTPTSPPAPAAMPPPAMAAAATSPPLPTGQVWECTVNGQKVFSDTRCGSGASVKQLGDLNVMDVPPPRYVYAQPYGAYPYPAAASYPNDEDDDGEVNGDAYPSQIILARERARREHRHHPEFHARPSAPAHGAAPRSAH